MNPLPPFPPGGEIAADPDATGTTFRWPAYKPGARRERLGTAAFLAFWLAFWTFGGVMALAALASGRGPPFLVLWLCGWAAGEAFVAWKLWNMLGPVRPESVRLESDRLVYYPGRGPDEARSCAELPTGAVVPVTPAPAFELPRAAIERFGIDRATARERLYLDCARGRIEIGGCLTPAERSWLYGVLRDWLGAPRRRGPWAKGRKEEARA